MTQGLEKRVPAGEFAKNFGQYKEDALTEDLIITSHKRDSLAVMSIKEYRRLKALDTRKAYKVDENLPDNIKAAIFNEADKVRAEQSEKKRA